MLCNSVRPSTDRLRSAIHCNLGSVLVFSARFFFGSPALCILLGGTAYMFLTAGLGQLHLFLALGKALFLLFA